MPIRTGVAVASMDSFDDTLSLGDRLPDYLATSGIGLAASWHGSPRVDSRERLARGLEPEPSPRAFRQVIGGGIYMAVRLVIVVTWS